MSTTLALVFQILLSILTAVRSHRPSSPALVANVTTARQGAGASSPASWASLCRHPCGLVAQGDSPTAGAAHVLAHVLSHHQSDRGSPALPMVSPW